MELKPFGLDFLWLADILLIVPYGIETIAQQIEFGND